MGRYVLIESRGPFQAEVQRFFRLAVDLAATGEEVTLFLLQNGALAARKGTSENPLDPVFESGVEVLVDSFSLRERAMQDSDRHPATKPAEIGDLVDRIMLDGSNKVLWH